MAIRLRVLLIAMTLALFPLAKVTPSDAASGGCSVRADLPARIVIDRESVITQVRLSGCEDVLDYASARIYGPDGAWGLLVYGGRVSPLTTYAYGFRPGVYRTADGYGVDKTSRHLAWHYTSTVIKFGTRAGIAAVRVGSTVRITVAAYRFAAFDGFIGYGNRVVGLQQSLSPDGPWSVIAYANLNAAGRVTVATYAPAVLYYRAFFGDSASTFAARSAVVSR